MRNQVLALLSRRSTWILIAALANAGGLYVNPQAVAAIADVAIATANSIEKQEACIPPEAPQ